MAEKTIAQAFAARLEQALEVHPHSPKGYGKQKWLLDRLAEKNVRLSAEAVSRWFRGVAKPHGKVMPKVAQVLDVDVAWLSLGIVPDSDQKTAKARNLQLSGVVNVLAGAIQLEGGSCAFSDDAESVVDIFAIIKGKQFSIHAALAKPAGKDGDFTIVVPAAFEAVTVFGAFLTTIFSHIDFINIPNSLIKSAGRRRGGFIELAVQKDGRSFMIGRQKISSIRTFNGFTPAGS